MKSFKVKDFSLKHTLECGQYFRYELINDWYYINYKNKLFKVKQIDDMLYYDNIDKRFLVNFFSLDRDYKKIIKSINKDQIIRPAIKKYYGLRLIRQDPWECLISFICSANSNIPKIRTNINLISKHFGKSIKLGDYKSYTFPEIGQINSLSKLKQCKTGFRSKYIFNTNKIVDENFLNELRKLSDDDAKQRLMQLPGVGPKVADCILLFSLDKLKVYPIDVWGKRIFDNFYKKQTLPFNQISKYMSDYFGEYTGYAQQFLFHYYRKK